VNRCFSCFSYVNWSCLITEYYYGSLLLIIITLNLHIIQESTVVEIIYYYFFKRLKYFIENIAFSGILLTFLHGLIWLENSRLPVWR